MPRTDKRVDIRAYQILNHKGKMVGKKVDARKIDAITAYEVVQRESQLKTGAMVYAFRIVEAVVRDGKILETETAKGGDEMTLNQVTEQIAIYRKFHNAPVKTQTDIDAEDDAENVQAWHGKLEIEFKANGDLDADEAFDAIWISKNHIEQRDGGIFIRLPKGMSFVGAVMPEESIYMPKEF